MSKKIIIMILLISLFCSSVSPVISDPVPNPSIFRIEIGGPYTINVSEPFQFHCDIFDTVPSTYTFLWNFGDGNISRVQNPIYTYHQTRNYTVICTAIKRDGSRATDSTIVTVILSIPLSPWDDFQTHTNWQGGTIDYQAVDTTTQNITQHKVSINVPTTSAHDYTIRLFVNNFTYCKQHPGSDTFIFFYDDYHVLYDYSDIAEYDIVNNINLNNKLFTQTVNIHIDNPSPSGTFVIDPSFTVITAGYVETNINTERKIAVTSNCTFHIAYSETVGGTLSIFHGISYDYGETWLSTQISTPPGGAWELLPCVAVTSNDTVYFVFSSYALILPPTFERLIVMKYYSDTMSYSPQTIVLDSVYKRLVTPSAVVDSNDVLHITAISHHYTGAVIDDYRVWYQNMTMDGILGTEYYLYDHTLSQSYPTIEVNHSDIPFITWTAENATWWIGNDQIRLIHMNTDYTTWSIIENVSDYTLNNYPQQLSSMCFRQNDSLCVTWQGGTTSIVNRIRFRERYPDGSYGSLQDLTTTQRRAPSITREQNGTLHIVYNGLVARQYYVQIVNQTNGVWSAETTLITTKSYYPIAYYSQQKVPLQGFMCIYINDTYTELFFYKTDNMVTVCMIVLQSSISISKTFAIPVALWGGGVICFSTLFYLGFYRKRKK